MIVNFDGQLGYGMQFAKFITIDVGIASFIVWDANCKYLKSLRWFSTINPFKNKVGKMNGYIN